MPHGTPKRSKSRRSPPAPTPSTSSARTARTAKKISTCSRRPKTRCIAGAVAQVRVLHSDGELYLKGEDLRRVLGYTVVASTQFDIEFSGLRLQFTGRGAGHGVGLCQWGAKELAERGYPAETILRYYYPGTELRELASLPRR